MMMPNVPTTRFLDNVLELMRAHSGSASGKRAVLNPGIALITGNRCNEERYAAAHNLIKITSAINRGYLEMEGRHVQCIDEKRKEVEQLAKARKTPYDEKKRNAFRHPRLWLGLINEAEAIATQLSTKVDNPTPRWATDVRNIAYLVLQLTYPMRVNHFVKMRFDEHFNVLTYLITFEGPEVKNGRPIDYILPEGRKLNWVRTFIDMYLNVARPYLLDGKTSPFVFVPDQRVPNAGLHIRPKGFNDSLATVCQRFLKEVLPVELGMLNPHLVRHLVASYQLVVNKSLTTAAQLLNDKPETVLAFYSDVLESARDDLKDYLDNLDD